MSFKSDLLIPLKDDTAIYFVHRIIFETKYCYRGKMVRLEYCLHDRIILKANYLWYFSPLIILNAR